MSKHKMESVLNSNFGFTTLTLWRYTGRLEEIQKKNPAYSYKGNNCLQRNIDSAIKALEQMKSMIPETVQ